MIRKEDDATDAMLGAQAVAKDTDKDLDKDNANSATVPGTTMSLPTTCTPTPPPPPTTTCTGSTPSAASTAPRSILKTKTSYSYSSSRYNNYNYNQRKKLSVAFGMVEIIEFGMIVGDHPDTSSGCPLTIDWDGEATSFQPVRFAEEIPRLGFGGRRIGLFTGAKRAAAAWHLRQPRKSKSDFKLSPHRRSEILLNAGYTISEITEGAIHAEAIKKLRIESVKNQKWDNFHAVVELARRRVKKLVTPTTTTTTMTSTPLSPPPPSMASRSTTTIRRTLPSWQTLPQPQRDTITTTTTNSNNRKISLLSPSYSFFLTSPRTSPATISKRNLPSKKENTSASTMSSSPSSSSMNKDSSCNNINHDNLNLSLAQLVLCPPKLPLE